MDKVSNTYRIKKVDIWSTLNEIRAYHLEHWPSLLTFREDVERLQGTWGAMQALQKVQDLRGLNNLSELQVFFDEEYFIIRPQENGQFFSGNVHRWPNVICPVYGSEAEIVEIRKLDEWITEQIKLRRYFIYLLVSRVDYAEIVSKELERMI